MTNHQTAGATAGPALLRRFPEGSLRAFTISIVCAFACAVAPAVSSAQSSRLAIEHVTVLPFAEGTAPLRDRTVVLNEGRIELVEPSQNARLGTDVKRIDGRGKWLMPSLTDMHVHLENERMLGLFTKQD